MEVMITIYKNTAIGRKGNTNSESNTKVEQRLDEQAHDHILDVI